MTTPAAERLYQAQHDYEIDLDQWEVEEAEYFMENKQ